LGVALIVVLDVQPPLAPLLRQRFTGHVFETAMTATEAVRAFRRSAPSAVFVALRKPSPEGWRFLRHRRTRTVPVPVVVFSDDPAIAAWARRVRASAFFYLTARGTSTELTVSSAARRLRVTPDTVRRWIREGKLAARVTATRSQYRISESDLSSILPSVRRTEPDASGIG
jgi:excisionase family DNA binding protein